MGFDNSNEVHEPDLHGLTAKLARGTGVNLAGFLVRVLLVFLHSLLGARLYGAERFGIYAQGVSILVLLNLVGLLGMQNTVTHFVAASHARRDARGALTVLGVALRLVIPASAAVVVCVQLSRSAVGRLFDPAVAASLGILSLSLPFWGTSAVLAAFGHGLQHMRPKVVAQDVVGSAVELLGAIALAGMGFVGVGLSMSYLLAMGASASVLGVYTRAQVRRLKARSVPEMGPGTLSPVGPMMRFAAPLLGAGLLSSATSRIGVLMLGVLGTSAMVGVLSVMQQMVNLGDTFLIAIGGMLGPMVADLVQRRQMSELSHLYKSSARWALSAGLPVFLTLALFRGEFLRLFGREFVPGATALVFLIVGQLANVATGSCAIVLTMSGHPRYSAINEAIMLVTVVGLSYLLIRPYGLLGAAAANCAGSVLVNSLRVIEVWWHLRIHPFGRSLVKVALAGLGMVAVSWTSRLVIGLDTRPWYWMVFPAALAFLTYLGVLVLQGLEPTELDLLSSVRKRLLGSLRWRAIGG